MVIDIFLFSGYDIRMINKCCRKNSQKLKEIRAVKDDLDVLNDENRLRILCLLKKHKEVCVCDIFKELDLPQNLVSYHLGKLKEAGFVTSRKDGVKVLYQPGKEKIDNFISLTKQTLI
jgi:ArsR family transcriptional regulator